MIQIPSPFKLVNNEFSVKNEIYDYEEESSSAAGGLY